MKEYYCPECKKIERVGDEVMSLAHLHEQIASGLYQNILINLQLARIIPPITPGEAKATAEARFEAIEFTPGKSYLLLYDPFSVESRNLIESCARELSTKVNIVFVPCIFEVLDKGFVSETVTLESLKVIEDWVAEQKRKDLLNEKDELC